MSFSILNSIRATQLFAPSNVISKRYIFSSFRRKRNTFNRDLMEPGIVAPTDLNSLPTNIIRPRYVPIHGSPDSQGLLPPPICDFDKIQRMKQAGRLTRLCLEKAREVCKEGITTHEIDRILFNKIIELGAYPSPLNYMGYPKSICTSVNNVLCHGIPDDRMLRNGDIINIDISLYKNNVHGDASETFVVGSIDNKLEKLVDCAKSSLFKAIEVCRPGRPLADIGKIIDKHARENGFSVSEQFVGHGIGEDFHCSPLIHHVENQFSGLMQEGMVFTIEPILCEGSAECSFWSDGWTAVTKDGGYTAQFEHSILITKDSYDILTL